ncbi:hypothetical protein ACFLTH_02965 [Bacteroidota bacterium]
MKEKEFINNWKTKIGDEMLKSFPDDFIGKVKSETIDLPGKSLTLSELFNSYEILDADGNNYFTTDDYVKVKYILYGTRFRPKKLAIPKGDSDLKKAVKEYEKLLDSILREMEKDYKKIFPDAEKFMKVSNQVFNSLNLQRY